MRSTRAGRVIFWVLAALVAALFLVAGLGKLGGGAAEMFSDWGYAPWFAILIGVLEVAGGIGLLIPMTTRLAVYGLTIIMLGAVYTHVAHDGGLEFLRPVVFLVLLWVVWWLRGAAGAKAGGGGAAESPSS